MSQAFEPFIEPWHLNIVGIKQDENSIEEISIRVEDKIELNLTYGMAVQIREVKQRILDKTLKIEEELLLANPSKNEEVSGFW